MNPAALLLLLAAAQPAPVTATRTADAKSISLSETVRVTLTVEGAAPLRFDPPNRVLSDQSFAQWKITPDGPPAVEALPGDRARWRQAYRLDPFVPGENVPLSFAPLDVRAGTDPQTRRVEFPPLTVTVRTAIAKPTADDARPTTGIEELPDTAAPDGRPAAWVVGGGLVAVLAAAVAGWLVRCRRGVPPVPPVVWAAAELDAAERGPVGAVPDRLAAVVRGFAERKFGTPAAHLTTAELLADLPDAGVGPVLERCDLARFAGVPLTAAEAAEWVRAVREWVRAQTTATASVHSPGPPPPGSP